VRPAAAEDIEEICRLLDEGFNNPEVGRQDWRRIFEHSWSGSSHNFGFVLTIESEVVGFLGTIYSRPPRRTQPPELVCNLTSWYVRPEYRGWGALLLAEAMRDNSVTYTSLTPGPETQPVMQSLNFATLEKRRIFAPLLNLPTLWASGIRFEYEPEKIYSLLNEADRRIYEDHAHYDLLHVVVRHGSDSSYLVLKRRVLHAGRWIRVPFSEMLYCSKPALLARHFEWIKLALLARQRTILLAAHERFVPATVRALRNARLDRYRSSSDLTAADLDLLYSEFVLLPI
jgi:acetoacetyl-CoA synthetase